MGPTYSNDMNVQLVVFGRDKREENFRAFMKNNSFIFVKRQPMLQLPN
jgi:hypothetical protein